MGVQVDSKWRGSEFMFEGIVSNRDGEVHVYMRNKRDDTSPLIVLSEDWCCPLHSLKSTGIINKTTVPAHIERVKMVSAPSGWV